jgi:hypothetical protein
MRRFSDYLREELESCYLLEGLSASYDVGKLASEIKKIIGNKIRNIDYTRLLDDFKKTNYGNVFTINIELNKPLHEFEKNKLSSILNFFGYTEAFMFLDELHLQIEPKYPVKINDYLKNLGDIELFHITEKKYLEKIKKIGLAPKKTKTEFDHPANRIYFLIILKDEYKKKVLTSWRRVLSKNKKIKPNDMVILKTHFDPSYNYYFDDTSSILNSGIIGIFSINNVNPNDLSVYSF